MLDICIYPLYLSLLTLGMPSEIKAMARMTETSVDSYCSILLGYDNSAKAMLESTFETETPIQAAIYGTKGKTESPKLPLSVSMDLISLIDRVKSEIGLSY
ncbi:MAG: hypothetical protein RQ761_04455 [Bacteroidales bacterium]|nr:hypothetical protein [Bacteroidales bacterium]